MSKNARPKNNTNDAALLAVMAANPGATVSALAYDAGMSVSTARAILARMADDGTAVRAADPDATRATYRWTLADTTGTTTADIPAPPTPGDTDATPTDKQTVVTAPVASADLASAAPTPPTATAAAAGGGDDTAARSGDTANADSGVATVEKLPPGALRGMVEDYLRENPGESFSPTALKKALEQIHAPRQLSSGAISNALEKLTTNGVATRTSDAPKKWALTAGA